MNNSIVHSIQQSLERQSETIYIGVSGGIDSMCLLHACHSLKLPIHVLHVNYGLRAESDQDETFVHSFCSEQNIPFDSLKVMESPKGNIQEWARVIRFNWFQSMLDQGEKSIVFLAQHADDQIETFLMHLIRQSGARGLSSMRRKQGRVIRPLLGHSRHEIEQYASKNQVLYRTDKSNATGKYERNVWRNRLIPALNDEIPTLRSSIETLIPLIQDLHQDLEQKAIELANSVKKSGILSVNQWTGSNSHLKAELFYHLEIPVALIDQVDAILQERGKKIHLEHAIWEEIVHDSEQLTFVRAKEVKLRLSQENVSDLPQSFDKESVYLDADKIAGDLKIRLWQEGDKISPIGINGSTLVSKIVHDLKLDAQQKRNIWVLHDDKTIHWVVGLKVGRLAIANNESIYKIKCSIQEVK